MTSSPAGLAVRVSRSVAGAVVVASATLPSLVERASLPVLLVGILLVLPHGAFDHLVPFRTGWLQAHRRRMPAVLAVYLAVAALAWAGLVLAGPVVLPVLLVVSVLHFGLGDLMAEPAAVVVGRSLPWTLVEAVARGGWVVAGPLLAWPGVTAGVLAVVGSGMTEPGPAVRLGVPLVVAGCSLAVVRRAARRGDLGRVLDLGLLATLFLVAPPLVAFGVYFGAWHGLRHTARLVETDRSSRDEAGTWHPALRRFAREAALPTAVALLGGASLVVVADGHRALAGGVFAVLLALTVPHLVAVALLDRDRTAAVDHRVAVA